jgi:hypothetical protein
MSAWFRRALAAALCFIVVAAYAQPARADNPIVQTIYTAGGSGYLFNVNWWQFARPGLFTRQQ